jgi:predicted dienelactone hydrolase
VIDMERIGVSGHSFGGMTALAVGGAQLDFSDYADLCAADPTVNAVCAILPYTETLASLRGLSATPDGLWPTTSDPRVKAIVAMAPASGFFTEMGLAGVHVPTMLIVGSEDEVLPVEINAYATYEALNSVSKALVVLENGGHYLFVTECSRFPGILVNAGLFSKCSDRVWDMERAHDLIDHFSIAFLLNTLKDDEDALAALQTENEFIGVDYEAEMP